MSVATLAKTRSVKEQVSAEEWQMRVDLAALYRLVAKHGMTDLVSTHLSARVPGNDDHFLINPYGLMFEEITASNLVKIDTDGNVILDTGYPINPAGFTIHSAVHMARHDVACVAHTHTVAGIAVSSLQCGLLPLNQSSMMFHGDRLAYHDWEGIATNLDERERLVADLGSRWACILRNHGLMVCGPTVAATWKMLYLLEKCCQAQLDVMAAAHGSGRELYYATPEVADHTGEQFDNIIRGEKFRFEWECYLAELDDMDDSYRH
jgi:ribulose-5-phosphate 4-epimerase/fuculose-1-phosphate aldolase